MPPPAVSPTRIHRESAQFRFRPHWRERRQRQHHRGALIQAAAQLRAQSATAQQQCTSPRLSSQLLLPVLFSSLLSSPCAVRLSLSLSRERRREFDRSHRLRRRWNKSARRQRGSRPHSPLPRRSCHAAVALLPSNKTTINDETAVKLKGPGARTGARPRAPNGQAKRSRVPLLSERERVSGQKQGAVGRAVHRHATSLSPLPFPLSSLAALLSLPCVPTTKPAAEQQRERLATRTLAADIRRIDVLLLPPRSDRPPAEAAESESAAATEGQRTAETRGSHSGENSNKQRTMTTRGNTRRRINSAAESRRHSGSDMQQQRKHSRAAATLVVCRRRRDAHCRFCRCLSSFWLLDRLPT